MSSLSAVYNFFDGFRVTDDVKKNFDDEGYILVRGMFNRQEMTNIRRVFEDTDIIKDHGFGMDDGHGRKANLVVWNHPGNDVIGMTSRCEKVVNTCENLLGGEVYHYHGKLLYKNPFSGGSFLWHQDYGYWYHNQCLLPDMMTVFIAIDKCSKTNGCLQIIPGSQKCGRIEHDKTHGQTAANVERVKAIESMFGKAYVEMEPGDVLFFHCNLLHSSSANESPHRRWACLLAYNTRDNNPLVPHHHAQYTPIHKVPNNAVRECTNFSDFTGKDFSDPTDTTLPENALLSKQVECERLT